MSVSPLSRQWQFDASIVGISLNRRGDWLCVALADGTMRVIEASDLADEALVVPVHKGISLSLKPDADEHAFLSGGDDGQVFIIDPTSDAPVPLVEHKRKWIDHVDGSVEGMRAYSCGKQVFLLNDEGQPEGEPLTLPSSVGGLAFSPNGKRLAVSHYNGVSLFWMNAKTKEAEVLPWKGSHLPLIWTPDGKVVLSCLQEGSLHGWQLSDGKEMQMQGYAGKPSSMAFTARGKYLATSGADQIICWPFAGGGPWGKPPVTLSGSDGRMVTAVAPHPRDEIVAGGYEDGMVVLAPLDGRMEVMLHPPSSTKGAFVVAMTWNAEGDTLFVAQENGSLLMFTLASVSRAFGRKG